MGHTSSIDKVGHTLPVGTGKTDEDIFGEVLQQCLKVKHQDQNITISSDNNLIWFDTFKFMPDIDKINKSPTFHP